MADCIYSDWHGECSLWDPTSDDNLGCDGSGYCWAEDDPDPTIGCDSFESSDPDEEAHW